MLASYRTCCRPVASTLCTRQTESSAETYGGQTVVSHISIKMLLLYTIFTIKLRNKIMRYMLHFIGFSMFVFIFYYIIIYIYKYRINKKIMSSSTKGDNSGGLLCNTI